MMNSDKHPFEETNPSLDVQHDLTNSFSGIFLKKPLRINLSSQEPFDLADFFRGFQQSPSHSLGHPT
jgi:hypothetical protein